MARLNEKGINAVKKAVVTAATGPVGSTFGQPMFEGEKMPMSGKLKEVEITRTPQVKPSSVSLPDVINMPGLNAAYKLDDLVAQGRVLKEQYGENSPMVKLYNNLISGKGSTVLRKLDERRNPSSSVDTLQTQVGVYAPFEAKKANYKKSTQDELGVYKNKKGQTMGFEGSYDLLRELGQFLQKRGVKRTRSLGVEGTSWGYDPNYGKPQD
jgi:hypothetical protein